MTHDHAKAELLQGRASRSPPSAPLHPNSPPTDRTMLTTHLPRHPQPTPQTLKEDTVKLRPPRLSWQVFPAPPSLDHTVRPAAAEI